MNRYLNSLGGTMLLDTIGREEVREIVDRRLDRYLEKAAG